MSGRKVSILIIVIGRLPARQVLEHRGDLLKYGDLL
jgi:hypothetical protein